MVIYLKISSISKEHKKVKICLDNQEEILISLETYISHPLIIGNEITKKELEVILKADKLYDVEKQCYDFLYKRKSKNEVIEFLKNKDIKSKDIDTIIKRLEIKYLINDEDFIASIIEKNLVSLKGKEKIKEELRKRKISANVIEESILLIDNKRYKQNLKILMDKYKKTYKKHSHYVVTNKIKNNLFNNGYSLREIEENINLDCYDENEELSRARKDLEKIRKTNLKDESKIKAKLIYKGYKYDIINKVLGEVKKDETN